MLYGIPLPPRVTAVEALPGWMLLITFDTGERKRYSVEGLLDLPAFKGLRSSFHTARVAYGTVVWDGDIDISPDALYEKGVSI